MAIEPEKSRGMGNRREKALFLLALTAGVLAVFLRIHTYATGQEPGTCLLVARKIAGGTVPLPGPGLVGSGWPLVLAAVIRLFGIHAAFWTNVPLFVMLAWTIRALAEELSGRPRQGMAIAAGSALLMLGGCKLNPFFLLWTFRQTPAYLAGMLSLLCLARAVRRQAGGNLAGAAGWLAGAGLATAAGLLVRSTGVLLLPAMGLYLLANALGWAGPSAGTGKPLRYRWFLAWLGAGACAAVVLAAFLFHVRLPVRQDGFPDQWLPWILDRPFWSSTWGQMLKELPSALGGPGILCLLAGIVSSLRSRYRGFFFLFFLPALACWGCCGALPGFHWRTFLSLLVFLSPLAMLGACAIAERVWRIAIRLEDFHPWTPRRRRAAVWGVMALWFLHVWARTLPLGPRASRADVDRALAAMAPWVGPDRPLLVDPRSRCLADLVEVFAGWPAEPVMPSGADAFVRTPELVFARPLDGKGIHAGNGGEEIRGDSVLDNNVRLEEVPGTNVFFLGDAAFRLERVLPWRECRTACSIPPAPEGIPLFPPPPASLLRVRAHAGAATNPVRVSLQGREIAGRLHPGYNFLAVPRSLAEAVRDAGGGELVFEADAPIPDDFAPEWMPPDTPLEMVFGPARQPSFDNYLSGEFRALAGLPLPDRNYPGWPVRIQMAEFGGDGRIFLPEGMDGEGVFEATWLFSLTLQPVCDDPDGTLSVTLSLPDFPGILPQTAVASHAGEARTFCFKFPSLPHAPRALELHVDHDMSVSRFLLANPRVRNMQLIGFSMETVPVLDSISLPIGRPWDGRLLEQGFHRPERIHDPDHGRWTDGAAEIGMPLRSGRDYRLDIDFDEHRPAFLPPAKLRLEWNGELLEASPTDSGISATVPSALVGAENTLRILSDTWHPSDVGVKDGRTLGIYLRNVTASPL